MFRIDDILLDNCQNNTKKENDKQEFLIILRKLLASNRLVQNKRKTGHPYNSRQLPKVKKQRTSFSRWQLTKLELEFEMTKYLSARERTHLAKQLEMTDAQVKTWFQNRRTKWRRQDLEERIHRENRLLEKLAKSFNGNEKK
ncbi:hypothetical protein SNEBB_004264 [Seison nebaliae]|nr:hypothetical protein SNEBB_004264 [Seison nebaliae]